MIREFSPLSSWLYFGSMLPSSAARIASTRALREHFDRRQPLPYQMSCDLTVVDSTDPGEVTCQCDWFCRILWGKHVSSTNCPNHRNYGRLGPYCTSTISKLPSNCSLRSSQLTRRTLISLLNRSPKRLLSLSVAPSISSKSSVLLTRRFSTLTDKMTDNNPGRLSAADPNSYSNIGVL